MDTHGETGKLKFQKYFRKMKDEVSGNNCISPYNGVNSFQIETGCVKGFVERKILHLWVENEKKLCDREYWEVPGAESNCQTIVFKKNGISASRLEGAGLC